MRRKNEHDFLLPDGRHISWLLFGDSSGFPIVYMHGTPGSALEAAVFDRAAKTAGAMIIAVDRPGIAGSTHINQSLAQYCTDIAYLADSLELNQFSVMGWSGGGPYALVTGAFLASKVRAIGLIAPQSSKDPWEKFVPAGLLRAGLFLYRGITHFPSLLVASFRADDIGRHSSRPPGTYRNILARSARRATRKGTTGLLDDALTLRNNWGVDLEHLTNILSDQSPPLPVWIVQGGRDWIIPARDTDALAARIPHVHRIYDPTATHLQTLLDHTYEVVRAMVHPRQAL